MPEKGILIQGGPFGSVRGKMSSAVQIRSNSITEGVIWKQILRFFFPILLGTLFQTLYNTADAIIVGNLLGKEALAAVSGGTAVVINLLIGFFTGLSSGATVIISQFYGARDEEKVHKSIHNAWAIGLWGGILISVIGYITSEPLLVITKTPADILAQATEYIHIYFIGGVVVVMYNIGAGIFRAFGDSRRPLYFLIVGCISNIVLDIVMIGVLKMGVAGAAWATVLSQLISLLLVMISLMRRTDCCKLILRDIKFEPRMLKQTLFIGFPAGFQAVLYTISNLLIMTAINMFGTNTVAAWAAYSKIDQIYWMICNSMGITVTTFVGQNFGAGLIDRAKKGVRDSFVISMIVTFTIEALIIIFSRYTYMLFVNDPDVIDIGVRMINTIVPYFFIYLFVELLSGAARGTGKTIAATIITVFGIVGIRVLWLIFIPRFFTTIDAILVCYPATWIICAIAFIIYYKVGNIYYTGRIEKT